MAAAKDDKLSALLADSGATNFKLFAGKYVMPPVSVQVCRARCVRLFFVCSDVSFMRNETVPLFARPLGRAPLGLIVTFKKNIVELCWSRHC